MEELVKKYNIGYLDEEELWQAMAVARFSTEFNVTVVDFPITLDRIWPFIVGKNLDAMIVDFRLYGSGQVSYDGADVVSEIMKHNAHFPIFIMTSYEEDAIEHSENVLIVNGKDVISDQDNAAFDRFTLILKNVIRTYKDKVADAKAKILEIKRKVEAGEILSPADDEALFRAELFLNEIDKDNSLPSNLTSIGYSNQLKELIDKTDSLIKSINSR